MDTLSHSQLWAVLGPEARAEACAALWSADDALTQQVRVFVLATLATSLRFREKFLKAQPDAKKTSLLLARMHQPDLRPFQGDLLRTYLLSRHGKMIEQFLDVQGIPHEGGVLDEAEPPTVKSLRKGIKAIRAACGDRSVSLYLAFILADGGDELWAALPEAIAAEELDVHKALSAQPAAG